MEDGKAGFPDRRWPALSSCPEALAWLQIQADLGLARRTIEAYSRALADYLSLCGREGIDPLKANRGDLARYVRDLAERPSLRGSNVVSIDSGVITAGLETDGPMHDIFVQPNDSDITVMQASDLCTSPGS